YARLSRALRETGRGRPSPRPTADRIRPTGLRRVPSEARPTCGGRSFRRGFDRRRAGARPVRRVRSFRRGAACPRLRDPASKTHGGDRVAGLGRPVPGRRLGLAAGTGRGERGRILRDVEGRGRTGAIPGSAATRSPIGYSGGTRGGARVASISHRR